MYYKKMVGKRFGNWTVLEAFSFKGKGRLRCRCDCGRLREVDSYALYHDHTKRCGKCRNTILDEGTHMRCVIASDASFIFDKADLAVVEKHTWRITRGYVVSNPKGKTVYLHKLLLGSKQYPQADHISQDKMDNRRSNLRPATHMQNQWNRGVRRDSTTGYKGVCFDKRSGKYIAYINANKQRTYLGYFTDPVAAALAYDNAALKLHGEFACTNLLGRS